MKKVLLYLLLATHFAIVLWFWWPLNVDLFRAGDLASIFIALGRLVGVLTTNLILLQLILIGRPVWVESVFGLDKLSRIHRWNGHVILVLILLHPTLLALGHSILNQTSFLGQEIDFLLNWPKVIFAFIGVCVLLVTIGLSISIARRRLKYETWYFVHLLNYTVLFLIIWHQLLYGSLAQSDAFRYYWYASYIFAISNFLYFRWIVSYINFFKHKFTVTRVEPEGPATSIYISGRQMSEFKIKAGQFMRYAFQQPGYRLQAHPFSMSQAPDGKEIRLTAKAVGDFTRDMIPKVKVGTKVVIDGPYGVFTEDKIKRDKLLFIAGGIGITPIYSMLEDMGNAHPDKILLYANKTREETVFADDLETLSKQHNFKLVHILSDEEVPGYEHGRLDKAILARLVPDIAERDVFLCGPPPMMLALRKTLVELGVPRSHIYWERFAL